MQQPEKAEVASNGHPRKVSGQPHLLSRKGLASCLIQGLVYKCNEQNQHVCGLQCSNALGSLVFSFCIKHIWDEKGLTVAVSRLIRFVTMYILK